MSVRTSFVMIPFLGDLGLLVRFYAALGLNVVNGSIGFEDFEFVFVDDCLSGGLEVVFEVDDDLSEIEARIAENGGVVVDGGFDSSGPFIIATDPAGLRLRIGMSQDALARLATRNV